MLKPQRQNTKCCIFCGTSGNLSKEHFYSQWMAPLLPAYADPKYSYTHIGQHPQRGEEMLADRTKPGNVATKQFRVVCRGCNSGWMNDLEQAARLSLEPLIRGDAIALTRDQVHSIAKWVAMKTMVAEWADRTRVTTPLYARQQLREHGTIPSEFKVYLASHQCTDRTGYWRESSCIVLPGERPSEFLANELPNVEQVTFIMGKVVAHVNATFGTTFTLEDAVPNLTYERAQIWPLPKGMMNWPTEVVLSCDGIAYLSTGLRRILKSLAPRWGGDRGELLPW